MIASAAGHHHLGVQAWRFTVAVTVGFFWGCAGLCKAQAAEAVPLSYRVPDGCPSEAEFRAAVAQRGGAFEQVEGSGAPREIGRAHV